ncbi:ASPIC/UnbV domain-containing protein [bacterium]|nr:ASPIC/UnbV domain-containing protein [bacterium]
MRKDPKKGDDLQQSPAFEESARQAATLLDRSSAGEHSLSGNEPNRFFLNLKGKQFDDLSHLSGMAHLGDGRSVARWDYDHDGWQDLVSINANAPKLVWYRNQLGDHLKDRHFLAVRFQGDESNRDGYGVRLRAEVGKTILAKETRCGEGFSAQNSSTLLLGLGSATKIDRLSVRWPSGKEQVFTDIEANQLMICHESKADPELLPYQKN